jgi:phosphatidate phosphatase APP1
MKASLRDVLLRIGTAVEDQIDRSKNRFERDPVQVVVYRSYGTREEATICGRVLRQQELPKPRPGDPRWRNAWAMLRRFESDEVPGAPVRVRFGGGEASGQTDGEGYFSIRVAPSELATGSDPWHTAIVQVPPSDITGRAHTQPSRYEGGGEVVAEAEARVLIPPATAQFGVISDIDDTVLKTGATRPLQMFRQTLLGNAHTRLPFAGVSAFYRALERGANAGTDGSAPQHNPVFYVSSSPWNLIDFLVEFLRLQDIPEGPVLLRDLGLDETKLFKASHGSHKTEKIERIFETYPHLPFILIGDSGQHDPEIFQAVAQNHPDRVLAVYIRDVSPFGEHPRDAEVQALGQALRPLGIDLVLVPDTVGAARHAAERGWISPSAVATVQQDSERLT